MDPAVAIILVNYNGFNGTVVCVESLLEIKYDNYKLYIVDNASKDAEELKKSSFINEHATVIYSKENLGFSGGNNLAIEKALEEDFDYILLLNNDTTVDCNFLSGLVSTAEVHKDVGIVTGKIYFYYDRGRVWSAGGTYDRTTGLTEQFSGEDSEEFNTPKEITFATGCLMLIPMEVVRKIGLMDESYFLYSEDSDYCQRAINAGYKLMYAPESIIYHKVSASTGDKSPLQQRYMMRNNLYMIKKYGSNRIKAYIRISWHMFKHIVRGRRNLWPTIQGYIDFVKGITGVISK